MSITIIVPVVAHRLFGTQYSAFTPRGVSHHIELPLAINAISSSNNLFLPIINKEHGTRRSIEEIMEMFHPQGRLATLNHGSVNHLWKNSGVRFLLVGIVDEMIESDAADFIVEDTRYAPPLHRLNYPNAVNIYFCRNLEGARGRSKYDIHPDRPNQNGRIIISDAWHLDEERMSREESRMGDVIVVAHELGHALTLPHMQQPNNLMYGNGSTFESTEITQVQALIARQHGKLYKHPWFRQVDEHDFGMVEIPHVRRYLGEHIPAY